MPEVEIGPLSGYGQMQTCSSIRNEAILKVFRATLSPYVASCVVDSRFVEIGLFLMCTLPHRRKFLSPRRYIRGILSLVPGRK